jgi:hypothetical protein
MYSTKKILYIGVVTYTILIILSIFFHKERTIFTDIAFHLFAILKDKTWAIQNYRFVAAVTQAFPLVGSKLHLPLSWLAVLYSVAFPLVYASVFFALCLWVKNARIALAFLLMNTLMVTHTFYWVQSELPQGLAVAFLFFGIFDNILSSEKAHYPSFFIPLASIALFVVVFAHPLMIFVLTFWGAFLVLEYPNRRKMIGEVFAVALGFLVIKMLFFRTAYDSQATDLLKNAWHIFPNVFNTQANRNFLHYIWHDYYFLIIALGAVIWYYITPKKYLHLGLVCSFFLGYLFIVNSSMSKGAEQFYIENQYLILSVFVILPLVYHVLPHLKKPNMTYFIVSFVAFVAFIRIFATHNTYTNRLEWERNLLVTTANLPQKKLIITKAKQPDNNLLLMNWGTAYEFWLLSTIEQGESRSLILEEAPNEFDWTMNATNVFITKWNADEYNKLNPRYFKFKDMGVYVKY